MRLARYRPQTTDRMSWPRLNPMPESFSRVLEDFFGAAPSTEGIGWMPAVDIVDRDDELLLTAELPGLSKDDVHIEVADGVLTLTGEKREQKEEKQQQYCVVERSYGAFERSFTLPRAVAAARVTAEFKDGVLLVHMPKAEPTHGRQVEITS